MNSYALMLHACGLSQAEAAAVHNTRIDTVKAWASGRRAAPQTVVNELRDLFAEIGHEADQLLKAFAHYRLGQAAELPFPETDDEARAMRLPCVGAWRAMAAIFVARFPGEVRMYPYGSS